MASGLRYGVEVRSAQPADAAELARLLSMVGPTVAAPDMAQRLEAIRLQTNASALVATGYPRLSGLLALSWTHQLQTPYPVARIMALVVDPEERRRGIGRLMVKAASQAARLAGCHAIELSVPDGDDSIQPFGLATGFLPQGLVLSRVLRKRS